ncbi:MAG: hypothetical protein A2W36_02265 [Chloroflexi bacterium RBG_16_58_14]|nr:MAG: hypothetical protein A2W36_02265 [Chloroflexi bacterium RBG_16_58_14]
MPDEPLQPNQPLLLRLDSKEVNALPGRVTRTSLFITNLGQSEDFFEVSIQGIPLAWVSITTPVIKIPTGEEREVQLNIQPPPAEQVQAGSFPLVIRVVSQAQPDNHVEVDAVLVLAALAVEGRIGILMEAVQFTVTPGERVSIPVVILNQGLEEDSFRLAVEGIPAGWVSTATAILRIAPGDKREATLVISAPRSPQSRAGRTPFQIQVFSQMMPDQVASVTCTLTVAAYTQFVSKLDPARVEGGKPARVLVTNQGNIQQVYRLTWQGQGETLDFEPSPVQELRLPAGETGVAQYLPHPKQKRILAGEVGHSYRVLVTSAEKETQTLNGEVISRGWLPIWVLPVLVVICLVMLCASWIYFGRSRTSGASATQTAVQLAAATQTASFNQTAAAIIGEQDSDGDGLTNREEQELGTDPNNPDTDRDELLDGDEVKRLTTDPKNPDSDQDKLSDGEEVLRQGTDPKNPDTDADSLSDGDEVMQHRTDPKKPDTDSDTLNDGDEVARKTNPLKADSDDDGLNDGAEVQLGTDPLKPDTDNDRLTDGVEGKNGRECPDPLNPDTDGDGIVDGLDLDPCNPSNPSLTATAATGIPSVTPVTPTVIVPSVTPPPPALPGLILFESNRDGNPELYLSNPSSGNLTRLTISPGVDSQPAWSPDRSLIAFMSSREVNNEIFVMNQDGTAQVNLTANPADDQYPSWSADGQWIAFTSNRDGNQEIYMMRANGTDVHNISNNPASDYDPTWLSGNRLAFTSNRDGNQEIYIMNSDGTGQTDLTGHAANDSLPNALPDGDRIVFTSERDGNQEIYSMNASGGGLTRLTNNPAQDLSPAWSADSAWVAFTTNRDGNWEIYVIRADGSQPYNITRNPATDTNPAWR